MSTINYMYAMFNMDMTSIILSALAIVSSIISWFLAKRKYNTEVDSNLISNMKESLDFYEKLSTDNRERLEEVLKRNAELEKEVDELKRQVLNLMESICVDLTCQLRKRSLNLFNEHGVNSGQKMEKAELHHK